MKVILASDIHLDHISDAERQSFYLSMSFVEADEIWLCGDIANQDMLIEELTKMRKISKTPIRFVCGNHDFWGDKMVETCEGDLTSSFNIHPNLGITYSGSITNNDFTYIGVSGWADCRYASYKSSRILLNDEYYIPDLNTNRIGQLALGKTFNPSPMRRRLADEDASSLSMFLQLHKSSGRNKQVYVITHVPPFRQMVVAGKYKREDGMPYFSCKATGDVLREFCKENPDQQVKVFCGHVHNSKVAKILPNLVCESLGATYGAPSFKVIEV